MSEASYESERAASAREFKEGGGPGSLWVGMLAPPVVTLIQLTANYALVQRSCRTGQQWPLHLVALLALLLTLGCGLLSWRNMRGAGAQAETDGAGVLARSRFMAAVGLLISAFITLVVVAQWIAVFFFSPCQR